MENSKIEWTDHSWNAWEGCAKVSPGCKNCYAAGQHEFWHSALGKNGQQGTCWGINAPRMGKSAANWKLPLKWNRQAQAAGTRLRVFSNSMGDVFEDQTPLSAAYAGQTAQVPTGKLKDGVPQTRTVTFVDLATERLKLLRLIYDTPHLDWLLLTKRPEHIVPALEAAFKQIPPANACSEGDVEFGCWLIEWIDLNNPPANVWLGTSVENQEQADARIPHLLAAPAAVRFLSCEPLLSAVNLREVHLDPMDEAHGVSVLDGGLLHWVIVGGESGPKARPMHPDWTRGLRDQCQAAGVAFFFKQWGEWAPDSDNWNFDNEPRTSLVSYNGRSVGQPEGFDMEAANHIGRVGSGPTEQMVHVGKKLAGRLLDGRTWDEVPTVATSVPV